MNRHQIKCENRDLDLWIDGKYVASFRTFSEMVEYLVKTYVPEPTNDS